MRDVGTRTHTFEELLYGALWMARTAADHHEAPGREGALVVTHLEEAALWNDRRRQLRGLEPLGLDWRP